MRNAKHSDKTQALFLPQWWMSATQVKSGRKSPTSKINQIAKMEVKFQCQVSNVLLELRPPPYVANGPIKRMTEKKREAEGG